MLIEIVRIHGYPFCIDLLDVLHLLFVEAFDLSSKMVDYYALPLENEHQLFDRLHLGYS